LWAIPGASLVRRFRMEHVPKVGYVYLFICKSLLYWTNSCLNLDPLVRQVYYFN
jgi:hypothetical protein